MNFTITCLTSVRRNLRTSLARHAGLTVLTVSASLLGACTSVADTPQRIALYGDPAPLAAATRTIVISPQTRFVNVRGGDIVRFEAGDKSFAWNFNGPLEIRSFDLQATAPAGLLDHSVMAYIIADLYRAGSTRGSP